MQEADDLIPRRHVANQLSATAPTWSQAVASITLPPIAERSRRNSQGCGHLLMWDSRPVCLFGILYSQHPSVPFGQATLLLRMLASRRPGVSSAGRWVLFGRRERRGRARKGFRNLPGFGSPCSDQTLLAGAVGCGANGYRGLRRRRLLDRCRPCIGDAVFFGASTGALITCGSTAAISRRTSAT